MIDNTIYLHLSLGLPSTTQPYRGIPALASGRKREYERERERERGDEREGERESMRERMRESMRVTCGWVVMCLQLCVFPRVSMCASVFNE